MPATRDVIVIGGGVVGLACAYELTKAGLDVEVLEARTVGSGASSGNTGWVVPTLSTPLAAPGMLRAGLRSALDPNGALVFRPSLDASWIRWLWQFRRSCSQERYRAGVAALISLNATTLERFDAYRDDGVEFEMYATGMLAVAKSPEGLGWFSSLHKELVALGHRGDLVALDTAAARELEPALSHEVKAVMRTTVDRYVRPESLLAGLTAFLRMKGVSVREQAPVSALQRRRDLWAARVNGGELVAPNVVVAAGVSVNTLLGPLGFRLPVASAKGYSVVLQGKGTAPRMALYLSEAKIGLSPYDAGIRIAGVFELPGRAGPVSRRRLSRMVNETSIYLDSWRPEKAELEAASGWAGLRPSTPDGLPCIGPLPGNEGLYIAAGHGMLGVTLAPATADLITRFITAGAIPTAASAFQPARRI